MWHVTCDTWHVTRYMWHATCDIWHVTCLGGWSFSQNFSSLALTVYDLWYYTDLEEKDEWIIELINYEAVYRTAPAIPGMLKTSSSWKIIEVTHSRKSGCGCGSVVIIILLQLFFFLTLSTGVPWRQLPPEIAARWRHRLPSNNLTAHYNSQFFL